MFRKISQLLSIYTLFSYCFFFRVIAQQWIVHNLNMGFENLKLIVVTETFISVDVLKDVTNTISSNVYFTKQKYSYF